MDSTELLSLLLSAWLLEPMVWRYTNVYLYRLLFRSLLLHRSWLPDKVVWGTSMQSTAVASGTHPQPPHCHTPYKPTPPFSNHATFPSQSEMLPFHLSASTSSSSQPLTSKCATWFDLTLRYPFHHLQLRLLMHLLPLFIPHIPPSNTQQHTFHICLW